MWRADRMSRTSSIPGTADLQASSQSRLGSQRYPHDAHDDVAASARIGARSARLMSSPVCKIACRGRISRGRQSGGYGPTETRISGYRRYGDPTPRQLPICDGRLKATQISRASPPNCPRGLSAVGRLRRIVAARAVVSCRGSQRVVGSCARAGSSPGRGRPAVAARPAECHASAGVISRRNQRPGRSLGSGTPRAPAGKRLRSFRRAPGRRACVPSSFRADATLISPATEGGTDEFEP